MIPPRDVPQVTRRQTEPLVGDPTRIDGRAAIAEFPVAVFLSLPLRYTEHP
jgi:hypothetical protein